jgi:Ner family transcriptional regulator
VLKRTTPWDRHAILAEIKRRCGSLQAFSEGTKLSADHFSVALARPYPRAEKIIARKLGVPAQDLWPDRYYRDGTRRPSPYPRQGADASQNATFAADSGDV